jgi:hypothetical protein
MRMTNGEREFEACHYLLFGACAFCYWYGCDIPKRHRVFVKHVQLGADI